MFQHISFLFFIKYLFELWFSFEEKKKKTTNSNWKTGGNTHHSHFSNIAALFFLLSHHFQFQTLTFLSSNNGRNPKPYSETETPRCRAHSISYKSIPSRFQRWSARTRSSTCSTRRCYPPQEPHRFPISWCRFRSLSQ